MQILWFDAPLACLVCLRFGWCIVQICSCLCCAPPFVILIVANSGFYLIFFATLFRTIYTLNETITKKKAFDSCVAVSIPLSCRVIAARWLTTETNAYNACSLMLFVFIIINGCGSRLLWWCGLPLPLTGRDAALLIVCVRVLFWYLCRQQKHRAFLVCLPFAPPPPPFFSLFLNISFRTQEHCITNKCLAVCFHYRRRAIYVWNIFISIH